MTKEDENVEQGFEASHIADLAASLNCDTQLRFESDDKQDERESHACKG
jgi:hypothetical protein